MRKDEAVGNKKKMQVCLPKHNYKLDNNLLTVEPRAVDPHCFDAAPDNVILNKTVICEKFYERLTFGVMRQVFV